MTQTLTSPVSAARLATLGESVRTAVNLGMHRANDLVYAPLQVHLALAQGAGEVKLPVELACNVEVLLREARGRLQMRLAALEADSQFILQLLGDEPELLADASPAGVEG